MKASEVIKALEKQMARLKKFEDEDVSSFVLVIPPEGEVINFLTMDDHTDPPTFYRTLAKRLETAIESSQHGGVTVPGYGRR